MATTYNPNQEFLLKISEDPDYLKGVYGGVCGELMVQQPAANVSVRTVSDNGDILMLDGSKHPLSDYIKQYNEKYAGKDKALVDLEEHTPKMDNIKIKEELVVPAVQFFTSENTYCGTHNTVDEGGCKACKSNV